MTLTMTVAEVKKNLSADIKPGIYKLEDILLLNDRPIKTTHRERRCKP
jgi:hypothetical protein